MKTCFKCGESLDEDQFYKHPAMADGRLGKCKECAKRDVRHNHAKRRDYYREYDRSRANDPQRVAARLEYAKTEQSKASRSQAMRALHQRYPYKAKVRQAVSHAIREGRLIPKPCEVCGDQKAQAHHEDYTKPFDVVWLCTKHHAERHRELRRIERLAIAEKEWCNGW